MTNLSTHSLKLSEEYRMVNIMNVLFISHIFPPNGGAGVQRPLKFVKYLGNYGINPVVLTRTVDSSERWAPMDKSLIKEVPRNIPIYRIEIEKLKENERFYSKKMEKLRRARLISLGGKAIQRHKISLIFATMSPFEDCLVAETLSKAYRIPWVADLRDPWALNEFQVYRTYLHKVIEKRRMERYLNSAQSIIMNTPQALRNFRDQIPSLASKARVSITNGYDQEDFGKVDQKKRNCKFTIVHLGSMYTEAGLKQITQRKINKLLGRIENGVEIICRSHFFLVHALEKLLQISPDIEKFLQVKIIGSSRESDISIVNASKAKGLFEFTGYLNHEISITETINADLLLLPLHNVPRGKRCSIVPGKTYEYMATENPILAPVPNGDAKDFLVQSRLGLVCEPDDVLQMVAYIKDQVELWKMGQRSIEPNKEFIKTFERKNLTRQLADHLQSLL